MKHTLIVSPFKGCNLEITGIYNERDDSVGIPDYFEIDKIVPCEEDIYDLLEWVSANKGYMSILEELCIEQVRNDKPDYEED